MSSSPLNDLATLSRHIPTDLIMKKGKPIIDIADCLFDLRSVGERALGDVVVDPMSYLSKAHTSFAL